MKDCIPKLASDSSSASRNVSNQESRWRTVNERKRRVINVKHIKVKRPHMTSIRDDRLQRACRCLPATPEVRIVVIRKERVCVTVSCGEENVVDAVEGGSICQLNARISGTRAWSLKAFDFWDYRNVSREAVDVICNCG